VFGELRQLGYVIRDIESAMKHWTDVNGVGPFFYIEQVPLGKFTYKGIPTAERPEISIALTFSGSVQIELVQQRNEAPSMYLDYPASGQEGLQHVAYCPEDYEAAKRAAERQGLVVSQEGNIAGRGAFVYYQTWGHHGTCVELIEYNAGRRHQFTQMERIYREWDGTDPIRKTLPTLPTN